MVKPIKLKIDKLEKSRKDLFSELENQDESALIFKIDKNKWSSIQICFHLVKSEQLTLIALNKNFDKRENLKNCGAAGFFRSSALSLALKSGIKFKAPALLSNMPESYDFSELKKKWESIRISLEKYINNFPEELLNKAIFKHPIAGWLNLNQTVNFLQDHFDHHKAQVTKLLEEHSAKAYITSEAFRKTITK